MVRTGDVPHKMIILMDPPDHRAMRSLLNKAFTPRAMQSQKATVVELVGHYLSKADPDRFDVVQDFSGPFPVEVITRMAGVPAEYSQQVRHWRIHTRTRHDLNDLAALVNPVVAGSLGVLELLHDVAFERFTERFCNTSATCGACCRRYSEPC